MNAATWNLVIYAIAGDAAEHQAVLHAIDDMRAALATDQCHIAVQVSRLAKKTDVEPARAKWKAALTKLQHLLED